MASVRKLRRHEALDSGPIREVVDAFREVDGQNVSEIGSTDLCDGCGEECEAQSSTGKGELLCAKCTTARLHSPVDDDPILSAGALKAIELKIDADTFDQLDAEVLFCHAQAVTTQYNELVQTTHAKAQQTQVTLFHRDEEIHRLRVALGKIRSAIALAKSRAAHSTWIDGLTLIEQAAHDTHNGDER